MKTYELNSLGSEFRWKATSEENATLDFIHQVCGAKTLDDYKKYCVDLNVNDTLEWKEITREFILSSFLGCDIEHIKVLGDNLFGYLSEEYLVLTDAEADDATHKWIRESVWAFDMSFLESHFNFKCDEKVLASLLEIQKNTSENCNALLLALIKDFDYFVSDAVNSDGRGHFLATYDHEEHFFEDYYIYQV